MSSCTNCSNNCGASIKQPCSNQFSHHSIPHSKSFENDHYNEATKFGQHYHPSRHSFDQSISSNYKNYDCIDGIHAATDRNNGCHYSSIVGNPYQPNKYNLANAENLYNVSGNRMPLPAALPFPDPQIIEACCHQNSHYDHLFNGRNSHLKTKNADYSNCSFPPK